MRALDLVVYLHMPVAYLTYPAMTILVFIEWWHIVLTGLVSYMYSSTRKNGFRPGVDVQRNRGEVFKQGLH